MSGWPSTALIVNLGAGSDVGSQAVAAAAAAVISTITATPLEMLSTSTVAAGAVTWFINNFILLTSYLYYNVIKNLFCDKIALN